MPHTAERNQVLQIIRVLEQQLIDKNETLATVIVTQKTAIADLKDLSGSDLIEIDLWITLENQRESATMVVNKLRQEILYLEGRIQGAKMELSTLDSVPKPSGARIIRLEHWRPTQTTSSPSDSTAASDD